VIRAKTACILAIFSLLYLDFSEKKHLAAICEIFLPHGPGPAAAAGNKESWF
jgi:hypothetical protein